MTKPATTSTTNPTTTDPFRPLPLGTIFLHLDDAAHRAAEDISTRPSPALVRRCTDRLRSGETITGGTLTLTGHRMPRGTVVEVERRI